MERVRKVKSEKKAPVRVISGGRGDGFEEEEEEGSLVELSSKR